MQIAQVGSKIHGSVEEVTKSEIINYVLFTTWRIDFVDTPVTTVTITVSFQLVKHFPYYVKIFDRAEKQLVVTTATVATVDGPLCATSTSVTWCVTRINLMYSNCNKQISRQPCLEN